jgi:hypothetical protein
MGMKTQSPFAEFLSVTDQKFAHKVEDWLKKLELAPRGKPILKSSCTFCSTQRCAGSSFRARELLGLKWTDNRP